MVIIVKNWIEGFNKISFTKLLMKYCNLSLSEAKSITDRVLENEKVYLVFENEFNSMEFIEHALKIGVVCEIKSKK
jgi:hypothetical protein